MLNDNGNQVTKDVNRNMSIVLIFESEADLKKAYKVLEEGCSIIEPLRKTFFSECTVSFIDTFGVRWRFMIL